MARKLYAAYTKEQRASGFAARMSTPGVKSELERQANRRGALTADGKFMRSSATGDLRGDWDSGAKKSKGKGMRNYIRDGQTSAKSARSFTKSVGAIPFKADPYRR